MMEKRLYKSKTNKTIAGVCGGIGEYFGIDPTIIRLIWVAFCLAGGSGILAYVIACFIIPDEPESCGGAGAYPCKACVRPGF